MSIHDRAYELAKTIQQSEEYQKYLEAKEKLSKDEKNAGMLQEFRRQQVEIQIAEMQGEDIDLNLEQLEKVYQILSLNPLINEFLTAEYRFARIIADIQKILGEALDLWIDIDYTKKNMN
ncbi:MAG: YlbF family regulator [Desulfitobacteriaceae bacterium]|nr:YlbF family regulator [Desulfitobacteriaceae bacterium]MDD4752967.1 YlbF family regulator [Desulfitobacteriaceae bacterium]